MELANAFGELTDATEQRARFEAAAAERARSGKAVYPLDGEFLAALERGMPRSFGVALGVDRLVMLLADACGIDGVRMT
jgi:lysyl-tRNA synthetase class 2